MQQKKLKNKYPINVLTVQKTKTHFATVDDIIEHLRKKVESHPIATYIGIFDHYAHTKRLGDQGKLDSSILQAKNIICCFGKELLNADVMAVRPRSIGVVETNENFIISFMDAPNPQGHASMLEWVESIKK